MALQNINRGTTPNDGQGDSARAGALKINENFAYLLNAEATFKTIIGPQVSLTNVSGDVAGEINTEAPFTFEFANLSFIKYVEFEDGDIFNIYFFKLTEIGGGTKTFGNGGNTTLGATNLFLTGQKLKSVQDFQELNSTVTEDFGDIGTTSLIDYVNGIFPAITIQATSVGATILKAIVDDEGESYLFKGEAGDYGQGELQLVDVDLEALSESTQVSVIIDRKLDPFSFNAIANNIVAIKFIHIEIEIKDAIDIIELNSNDRHSHSNKPTLDNFGEDADGLPTYNGVKVDTTIAQRDVLNILTSTNTAVSLSANMGRVLKNLIPINNNQLTNGAGYITSADGGNAATLGGLVKSDFVRKTGNINETITGIKTFNDRLIVEENTFIENFPSGGTVISENAGNGQNIILRPNGRASPVGQTVIGTDGNLDVHGDVTADRFFESSDKRLKTNIKKISKSIYTYEFKKELGRKRYGTIAQEIEKTNPEVVKKLEDGGMMSVNYNSFLSLKLAEQENENKEQNNKIDSLQQQIDELKELIKN